ncbi:MAG: efflux RND transporter permease subunit [Gammaproteobacteria bacterium]|nr:efflux RND transporter permease subunit [Gammaproteobacteria bacterium]
MGVELDVTGRLAGAASRSRLTPLLALVGLLLGLVAAIVTPREEEPQIDVTMANVLVAFPGADAGEVESLVTEPMEQILDELEGLEHVYSVSRPGEALLTVQFEVGIPRREALVRLYNAIYSNLDWRPAGLGVSIPLVKPKSIDDVPILALTLSTADPARGAYELRKLAHALETEIKRVPGTRDIVIIGGPRSIAQVALEPARLAARGLSVAELRQALQASNPVSHAGATVAGDRLVPIQAGEFLRDAAELSELVVGMHEGRPVYLQDVAQIREGPAENTSYVWTAAPGSAVQPAVTLAIGKKPGENAVEVAERVLARVEALKGSHIPAGANLAVTRNYGQTAGDKAAKLIQKLSFATLSVVALVLLALGRREAVVVGAAVVLTLALTLFASWAWGFTLNRVSLFALIFSIGILVDDAIVVVENIHRHLALKGGALLALIPGAVSEVGRPTVLATFTVIAALLPMAFVSGLMGPYMSPIPINASLGMLISLAVALTVTPWLSGRLLGGHAPVQATGEGALDRLAGRVITPFLGAAGRRRRYRLGYSLVGLIVLALGLAAAKLVVFKMLPFDNKSEFQVMLDMPEGTPVERTNAVLAELAGVLLRLPEIRDLQAYAGTSAPISFNGLVRQYDLRQDAHLGDLQVNLRGKQERERSSHAIARAVRPSLAAIAARHGAALKVVEVPPGPPVMAPIVAELYGPDARQLVAKARDLRRRFAATADMVDVDDSLSAEASRQIVVVNRQRAAHLGISQADIAATLAAALNGEDVAYLHGGAAREPVPVRLLLPVADKGRIEDVLALKLRARSGALVPMSEVVSVREAGWDGAIHHKDLLPVVYVTGDVAGALDSPLYAMGQLVSELDGNTEQHFVAQPDTNRGFSVKWDGEWQITYETFRDMGLAYSLGLVLIYLLVVGQFGSYRVPLVIMAPIPLTLIGILPGHALLGAQFTATSMIGMIALAGIIVRNSILLVDFIRMERAAGVPLEEAVVRSAAVRAKPIALTAVAAMLGALFILDDPIFNGLAVSLVFGILVSTLLTLVVIPLLYYSLLRRQATGQE